MQREWTRIQITSRIAGSLTEASGRAFGVFRQNSRKQFRSEVGASVLTGLRCASASRLSTGEAVARSLRVVPEACRGRETKPSAKVSMTKHSRRYQSAVIVPLNIQVVRILNSESGAQFLDRVELVQSMITEMILLARKKGRPAKTEVCDAKAA
jgi:hypothetical protein